ncbi:hypothetical protein [Idiomarina loihiensis]|uniref:hypothetical protein n=1 Tax=Idiomarina loihiensis TaxID=135577 RepID=UPI00384FAE2A
MKKGNKEIQQILSDSSKLQDFAGWNELSISAAREILQRLQEKPDISDEVNKYIWSNESSDDLKGYVSGEEKGYKRGHEAGFAKGAFLGVLAASSALAAYFLKKK